jgi:hypothetical protein
MGSRLAQDNQQFVYDNQQQIGRQDCESRGHFLPLNNGAWCDYLDNGPRNNSRRAKRWAIATDPTKLAISNESRKQHDKPGHRRPATRWGKLRKQMFLMIWADTVNMPCPVCC